MNSLELLKLDTEWINHGCAPIRCKPYFNLIPFFPWNDNWHLSLFYSDTNWCDSVGKKRLLNGRRSLSYGNNWNGWCYSIALIWIWLTQSIVTHSLMTLTVTKKQNWKVLCNLYADLHVRFFDMMTRQHNTCTFLSRCCFQSTACGIWYFFMKCAQQRQHGKLMITETMTKHPKFPKAPSISLRNISETIKWHFVR